jgi:hypothetical protein
MAEKSIFTLMSPPDGGEATTGNMLLWAIYIILVIMLILHIIKIMLSALVLWGVSSKFIESADKILNGFTPSADNSGYEGDSAKNVDPQFSKNIQGSKSPGVLGSFSTEGMSGTFSNQRLMQSL